jgi:2-polyprenyl-3-methyl-5-hydroxy-6-metoxy-1,4-benzoquinol methylase
MLWGVESRAADSQGLLPKPPGYYANTRSDLVALLERPLGSVLDVGCGSGGVGPGLRAAGATRLVGVELLPEAAAQARVTYDRVLDGPIDTVIGDLAERFDTILCLDVLEHLVDPTGVLVGLHDVVAPDGRLAVSVPNVRHYSVLRDLLVAGTFGYAEHGIRDSTHLRWFTRRDMHSELEATGWRVDRTAHSPVDRYSRVMRLSPRRFGEFLVSQWYFFARPAQAGSGPGG